MIQKRHELKPNRGRLGRVAIHLTAFATTLAAPLTFTHADSTWTIELEGDKLHVTADCPETWLEVVFGL